MLSEISRSQKDKHCDSTHTRDPQQSSSQRQEVGWWLLGTGSGGGTESSILMGTDFQFYKMKRVRDTGGGDGCTTA